jgi:hypothetical protein
MMNIDRLIQRARESTLSPERKAQMIRLLESIRNALLLIHGFVTSLIASIREHRDTVRVLAIALLLAVLAQAIPWIGTLLGFLVVLVGVAAAFIVELRRTLSGLFDPGAAT